MKKLLFLLIIPFLSFGQDFSPKLNIGIKFQSEYFNDPSYNTISNYELNENVISHAVGFIFGVNVPSLNLKLGVEGLFKPRDHMKWKNTKDYSAFAGTFSLNEELVPYYNGDAHDTYTVSDIIEFNSPYEINLYIDYSLFKNFSLSLISYLSPKNSLYTQNQEWMSIIDFDQQGNHFEEDRVVSSFENFEWIESGLSFGLSYLIKNIKLDIRIPIAVSGSDITGTQTLNLSLQNPETTEVSGNFVPKKGVVFSVTYLFQ